MPSNLKAAIEALLFVYGEPVKIKKLAQINQTDEETVNKALEEIKSSLQAQEGGLSLMVYDGEAVLTTKPELASLLQNVIKEEMDSELTPASLETLTIASYLGPCSRAEIDYVRGVNSAIILRSLSVRGLVTRKPDPERSNSYLYQVTGDFLRHIGLGSPEDLPEYSKYHELIKKLREINEAPENK
ncbi:MAG: SMC-Scp complex subunit ScpB [Patescibacteria group bacterium]|nr:SMC-Scp complex subunit ScpB [Patescibacteria group bacterium]MCL5224196.1 SMC-Scp complex subunit ScpB [Patescibacteria group bacterium]